VPSLKAIVSSEKEALLEICTELEVFCIKLIDFPELVTDIQEMYRKPSRALLTRTDMLLLLQIVKFSILSHLQEL